MKYRKAIADYNKAIQLRPGYVDAYNNRGVAQIANGNLNEAIADFTKVIDLGPEHCVPGAGTYLKPDCEIAYDNRARAKRRKGDVEGAAADHAKAVQVETDRENLGKALEQRR